MTIPKFFKFIFEKDGLAARGLSVNFVVDTMNALVCALSSIEFTKLQTCENAKRFGVLEVIHERANQAKETLIICFLININSLE